MIAKITTDGKYILADIPYAGGVGRAKAHEIPGAHAHYVDEKFQYWRYPLTMDTCRTFRRVFGEELQVSNALSAWARFKIQAEEDVEKLKQGGEVVWDRLPRLAPDLYAAIMSRS